MSDMTGQAIYENFANGDAKASLGCASLADLIAGAYMRRTNSLNDLIAQMGLAWKGDAAEAAQHGVLPLAVEHQFAAERLGKLYASIQRQVDMFQAAANSVTPVPPLLAEPGYWDNGLSPALSTTTYEQAYEAHVAANNHNIAVMRAYEAATRENEALLTAALANLNSVEPTPGPPPQPPVPPQPGPYPLPQPAPTPGGGLQRGGTSGTSNPPSTDSGTTGPATLDVRTRTGQTNAQYTPAQPQAPRPLDSGWSRPGGQGSLSGQTGLVPGRFGTDLTPVGSPASDADLRRGGTGGTRGFGPRGPGGAGGSGGPGEHGPRADARGGGIEGRRAGESVAGRGARGGASGLGSGSAGPGGHGQGEEDLEHYRPSYLVEADPEEVFGTDVVTAPSVIGE